MTPSVGRIAAAVLTVSDEVARGERKDVNGPAAKKALEAGGLRVASVQACPHSRTVIEGRLRRLAQDPGIDLIVTTGGDGVSERDFTPEATQDVAEKLTPGISEEIRRRCSVNNPGAIMSRGVAGVCGRSLIVNLGDTPEQVRDGIEALLPLVPHVRTVLRRDPERG